MTAGLLLAAAFAGAIVVLTPGPAVLALFGIGAAQGRRAGAGFLIGHLAGDLLWTVLVLVALVSVNRVSPEFFRFLALICGGYLLFLGGRALLARPSADGRPAIVVRRPLLRGLLFGVTNPKSYPVTLSVFTALLSGSLTAITAETAPALLAACFGGFLAADLILVWLVGLGPVRTFYQSRELWILRGTGLLFIGFALNTLAAAGSWFG